MNIIPPHVASARMQGWLVAFDPGMLHPAAAVFDRGVLAAASRVKLPGTLKSLPDGERARQIAILVREWVLGVTGGVRPVELIVERPQVYRVGRSKGDPNDLIKLAIVAGCVITELGVLVYAPTPHEWIGNIPKSTTGDAWASPRGMLLRRRLTELEVLAVAPSHDAVDAAALGAHALGRLGKVYSST